MLALAGLTMCFRFVHVAVALPELHNRVIMETNTIPDTFPPNPSLKTLETTARFIPVSYPFHTQYLSSPGKGRISQNLSVNNSPNRQHYLISECDNMDSLGGHHRSTVTRWRSAVQSVLQLSLLHYGQLYYHFCLNCL